MLTQLLPHIVRFAEQPPDLHWLFSQTWPPVQDVVQFPQWVASLVVLTQLPPHIIKPVPQVLLGGEVPADGQPARSSAQPMVAVRARRPFMVAFMLLSLLVSLRGGAGSTSGGTFLQKPCWTDSRRARIGKRGAEE